MIHDVALRWFVTLLFVFSAGVCLSAILGNRHSLPSLISHSLHAVMAIAMAVMAWPRGAEIPARAPMIFFAAAAVWFVVVTVRTAGHRRANVYHTLMMLAMAWMYAAMGGLPLSKSDSGTEMAGMPGMSGPDGMASSAGHGGHGSHTPAGDAAGHAGHAGHSGADTAAWVGAVNWVCAIGFAAAAVFWLYRYITTRLQPTEESAGQGLGVLCQVAMATGMAIMFGVML